jgi:hypothetical protein
MWQPSGSNSAAWQTANAPSNVIYPVATDFADSLENTAQVIGGVTAIRVSTWGRLFVNVPVGTTSLVVYLASNLATAGQGADVSVPVYVDGVFSTSWQPNVNGLQAFTLSLDGAAHTVQVWNGYESFLTGTYVWAVRGAGISLGTAPAVTRRLVCYGDSIMVGGLSSPPGQLGWFARMRAIYPGACAQEAWGGRQLWDDCGSGSGQQGFANVGLLADRLVGLMFGNTGRRDYWIEIGINDVGAGNWDAATFGTNYASLLTAIHSRDAGGNIYCQTMLTDQGAWTTAISTAAAGKAYCTVVDGTTLVTGAGLNIDGIHPTTVGHQAVALGTGAAASSSSVRAVLGV